MRIEINSPDFYTEDGVNMLYKGQPFTGEVIEKSPDGVVVVSKQYVNGMEHGPYRTWYREGVPELEGQHNYGLPTGTFREWYENGQLALEKDFDDRGEVVSYKHWDEDGVLVETG